MTLLEDDIEPISTHTRPSLEAPPVDIDPESIPIGSIVRTPQGRLAKVIGHAGKPRGGGQTDPFPRLICKYLEVSNAKFSIVRLQPKYVEVVRNG